MLNTLKNLIDVKRYNATTIVLFRKTLNTFSLTVWGPIIWRICRLTQITYNITYSITIVGCPSQWQNLNFITFNSLHTFIGKIRCLAIVSCTAVLVLDYHLHTGAHFLLCRPSLKTDWATVLVHILQYSYSAVLNPGGIIRMWTIIFPSVFNQRIFFLYEYIHDGSCLFSMSNFVAWPKPFFLHSTAKDHIFNWQGHFLTHQKLASCLTSLKRRYPYRGKRQMLSWAFNCYARL